MQAKQKLEGLTNAWYGYALFTAVISIFSLRANGVFAMAVGLAMTIVLNAIVLAISIAIITFLGRALVGRSSATRTFLVVVSAIFTLLGILGTVSAAWDFLRYWSIPHLLSIVLAACSTFMNARSFNVLMDRSVKSYFA